MKVYIMRHGTTVWNEIGRSQGRRQNMLSKEGKAKAELMAEKLKNKQIDVIYSSPLRRTIQTANIVNKYHNVPIIKSELLIEIDQGVFAGTFWKKLTDEEKQIRIERKDGYGMESYDHVYKRVKEFVENVLKQEQHKNILVVSHNNCCSIMEHILKNEPINFDNVSELNTFDNAEVREFEI